MTQAGGHAFDADALRAEHAEERAERLRVEAAGRCAHFVEDPYIEPSARAPIDQVVDFVVIGVVRRHAQLRVSLNRR